MQAIEITFNFPASQAIGYSFNVNFGIMNTASVDPAFYNNFP
jgi:hypothetical protein